MIETVVLSMWRRDEAQSIPPREALDNYIIPALLAHPNWIHQRRIEVGNRLSVEATDNNGNVLRFEVGVVMEQ